MAHKFDQNVIEWIIGVPPCWHVLPATLPCKNFIISETFTVNYSAGLLCSIGPWYHATSTVYWCMHSSGKNTHFNCLVTLHLTNMCSPRNTIDQNWTLMNVATLTGVHSKPWMKLQTEPENIITTKESDYVLVSQLKLSHQSLSNQIRDAITLLNNLRKRSSIHTREKPYQQQYETTKQDKAHSHPEKLNKYHYKYKRRPQIKKNKSPSNFTFQNI